MKPHANPPRPWYREPWPWVLITIPALTVIACAITVWLAVTRPDPLVVERDEYRRVQSEMRAQAPVDPAGGRDDG
jgi:hypothetical protein